MVDFRGVPFQVASEAIVLSRQEEEQERREVLENDRRVREQQQQRGSTYHQYAQSTANDEFGGRFAAIGVPRVVGSTPNPSAQYPAAAAHQRDPVGTEPPLGYSIDAMPGLEISTGVNPVSPPVATDDPANAPPSGSDSAPSGGSVSERAGSSPFPTDQDENQ
jgi:hypothetical protein